MDRFHQILKNIGAGQTGATAYDTAWIARLVDIDPDLSNQAVQWICENQLRDGSWGAEHPSYYHDRVISTLSAMIVLNYRGRRSQDRTQIDRGLMALEHITSGATRGLAADPNGATVGFEMIVPALVEEAERLGIIKRQGERILGRFSSLREAKMAKLAGAKINRHLTPAFSAEMAGTDNINLLDVDNLQEANGSVGNSPSATAYFLRYIQPDSESALKYLRNTIKGGAPFAYPFDVFERAWVLWNLSLLEPSDSETRNLCQPHVEFLQKAWRPNRGVGFAQSYTPCDSDDSSMTFDALAYLNQPVDLATIFCYEEKEHFRCYPMEITPSLGANIHILAAFRRADFASTHPAIMKIVGFIRNQRRAGGYWLDKWHTSPYYITSHAIIALRGYADDLCSDAIDWMILTQNDKGAWGYYGIPTAEETSYCIQALRIWQRYGGKVSEGIITQGAQWLSENDQPPYPPMWISKALYCPELVVQSVIACALELARG